MPAADVIIVGGGVIGSSIAYHLAREGVSCILIEREGIGAGASSIAAGMLTPVAERLEAGPLYQLGLASLAAFPDTLQAVHEASGIDPEYITAGTLRLAFTEDEERELRGLIAKVRPALEGDWLTSEEVQSIEPRLTQDARGALFTPGERQVRAARLTLGFAQAAEAQTGRTRFLLGQQVVGLTYMGDRITGVRLADSSHVTADHVVLAAGPWSSVLIEDLPSSQAGMGVHLPVRPVRGQILSLHTMPRPLRTNVFYGSGYLTPKVDGTVLVGATQEEAGFDTRSTAQGASWLLSVAVQLLPELGDASVVGMSVGLRPGTPDGLPIMGSVPGYVGLTVATGHFRSGILLSPITGQLIAEHITTGQTGISLEPFSLARFE